MPILGLVLHLGAATALLAVCTFVSSFSAVRSIIGRLQEVKVLFCRIHRVFHVCVHTCTDTKRGRDLTVRVPACKHGMVYYIYPYEGTWN